MPSTGTLQSHLAYEPQPLKFGTSGRRGLVLHLTQLEIYTNVLAETRYLQSLDPSQGGIRPGDAFYFAHDLRPSSTGCVVVTESGGNRGNGGNGGNGPPRRGGLCQAVTQALTDAGMRPVNLGAIPTPALTFFALQRARGSIMVTGSHIPFDRNGYKLNTSRGELLKEDERPIGDAVERVRGEILGGEFGRSLFDEQGMLRDGIGDGVMPAVVDDGRDAYIQRYLDFFAGETEGLLLSLQGVRVLVYQHSAVGRDVVVEILERLGARVTAAGRSETFVPIDTEAIDQAQLDTIQGLCDGAGGTFDAVVSTDGDSDRPLLVAPAPDGEEEEGARGKLRFFGGDLLGMVVAEYLGVDAVVVPISSNDAIDRGTLAGVVEPKTKIGSPYVIRGMQQALARGRRRVCGWEANGGFLTGSDIECDGDGRVLAALPTRDAMLPLLCALFAARQRRVSVSGLFAMLPGRFSRASLIRDFPRSTSLAIIERFSPSTTGIQEVTYNNLDITAYDTDRNPVPMPQPQTDHLDQIRQRLQTVFSADAGFAPISRINYTDGIRMSFANGDVAHIRPSGNADELRVYAVADEQGRADGIAARGVAEDGLLRRLEGMVQLN